MPNTVDVIEDMVEYKALEFKADQLQARCRALSIENDNLRDQIDPLNRKVKQQQQRIDELEVQLEIAKHKLEIIGSILQD